MRSRRTGPYLLGVDIGGSKIAFLARSVRSGRIVRAAKVKTPAKDGVDAVLHVIDAYVEALPGGGAALAAVGVAVAGWVDPAGLVLRAGNLAGWEGVPLRAMLERRYGVPAYVERDANCGAIGERWCGAARGMDDFVFLSLGTGIGAGIFVAGSLHRGAHCAAGEAGDLASPRDGDTVGDVVSKRAIKKAVRRATGEKIAPVRALARAAREPRLRRATRDVIASLSSAVIAIASLLDPEAIVVGGGAIGAGDALLDRIRRRVPPELSRARLVRAGLGTASPVYGALWGAEAVRRRPVVARITAAAVGSQDR